MSRKLLSLSVGTTRPASERDQVAIWFDDPHRALDAAIELMRAAQDAIRSGDCDAGITLLGELTEEAE